MMIQKSPNKWSCLPTSFAMVLEVKVATLIEEIGHNGSEIIFQQLPEPLGRKGFHLQEFIEPCLLRGYVLMPIEAVPVSSYSFSLRLVAQISFKDKNEERLRKYMEKYKGVILCGNMRHALAWDTKNSYNPSETNYNDTVSIREFIALVPKN